MSDSNRLVYISKKHRKRKRPERLHGAFAGGFSAGHYNTVGSVSGWKPSNFDEVEAEEDGGGDDDGGSNNVFSNLGGSSSSSKTARRRRLMQRPEDFMDEEDANEWGGPKKVNQSFQRNIGKNDGNDVLNTNNGGEDQSIKDSSCLRKLLYSKKDSSIPTSRESVGKQLLKVLGWREHIKENKNDSISYAYVPLDPDEKALDKSLLSSKRLKRIEMQLSSRKHDIIPPPKTNTYGMGYEPYKNAPEFKAHREKRQQRARERARAAASSSGDKRMNVYSMNDLYDDFEDDERPVTKITPLSKSDDNKHVLAYETMEDFIGTKTVGGFALQDDDDQVYDSTIGQSSSFFNRGEKNKINLGDYHNEAYEGSDSDVEEGDFLLNRRDLSTKQNHNGPKHEDKNKTKLNAFAGALSTWASEGKDKVKMKAVTSDGEALLDGFDLGGSNVDTIKRYPGPDVPADYEVKRHQFSHEDAIATLKELASIRRKETVSRRTDTERSTKPIAGKAFSSLSTSLKNRFTKSSNNEDETENSKKKIDPRNAKVTRTTVSWQPSHLLMKRFNIHSTFAKNIVNGQSQNKKHLESSREENFFQKDVLGQLKSRNDETESDQTLSAETFVVERPSYELMKSIFEPSTDEEESDNEFKKECFGHHDVEKTNAFTCTVKASDNDTHDKKKQKKSLKKREKKKKKKSSKQKAS